MELVRIGSLGKSRGVKGDIKLKREIKLAWEKVKLHHLFIRIDGIDIPYFIEKIKTEPNETIKFEGINSPESAKQLVGRDVYIRRDLIPVDEGIDITDDFELLAGYEIMVFDNKIGHITEIQEFPQQVMAVVELKNGKETFIPLNVDFIVKFEHERKVIFMDLPEGILNL